MMKRLFSAALVALGLLTFTPACVAEYDDPGPTYAVQGCPVVEGDGVVVEQPCMYYRVVWLDGIPYRYYYGWEGGAWVSIGWVAWRGGAWVYGPGWHGGVMHGGWHGGWHEGNHGGYHGGYHGGGGHGGGGHGGHR